MSVIFGICAPANATVDEQSLLRLGHATSRYGMDGTEIHTQGRIGMGFQAFYTQSRSRLEQQPAGDPLGNILVFDGRLDNHRHLAARLAIDNKGVPDSALILEAFARWGEGCFAHLIGDWALALWSANDQVLYLARDHAGTRTLFFSRQHGEIRWSTHLDAFLAGGSFPELNQEYIARLLSSQEIRNLTPYEGIQAVCPAHYISIREGQAALRAHWRPVRDTSIAYKSETEYDEHFLHLFRQAVQRRIGPGAPILAQLSGGVDSSSIVCMADRIVSDRSGGTDLLDTISYYDDTEPDWDERPYFTLVEQYRNKAGIHLDSSSQSPCFEPLVLPDRIYPLPGGDRISLDVANQFEQAAGNGRYRVLLSGIGGDELLGGVPTPMPELANYIRDGRILMLLSRAADWCMVTRQPLISMLGTAVNFTASLYRVPRVDDAIPPWLNHDLHQICLGARFPQEGIRELLKARPSAINNSRVWWRILETLPHLAPSLLANYEYRYPYLDRDLVEYLHRVPREQLVQPGRRRLLMRRALRGIVPQELLERKRKAYRSRSSVAELRSAQRKIEAMFSLPLSAELGLIDQDRFLKAFRAELQGDMKWIGALTKTIGIELWLRSLKASNVSFRVASHGEDSNKVLPAKYRATEIHAGNARS
jgi:asparagine synthase (glutamine-hydrolysing)